jgi:hypothetical protein
MIKYDLLISGPVPLVAVIVFSRFVVWTQFWLAPGTVYIYGHSHRAPPLFFRPSLIHTPRLRRSNDPSDGCLDRLNEIGRGKLSRMLARRDLLVFPATNPPPIEVRASDRAVSWLWAIPLRQMHQGRQ